jgi:hypothetical protein
MRGTNVKPFAFHAFFWTWRPPAEQSEQEAVAQYDCGVTTTVPVEFRPKAQSQDGSIKANAPTVLND